MLQVRKLQKQFDDQEVLQGVDFQVSPGQIVTIEGSSGGGKTTFLRCICGLESYDSGEILLEKEPLTKANRTKVGLVFQDYQLFPHLNTLENMIRAPKFLKLGTVQEIKQKALELLVQLGIGDKKEAYPYQLSGGQKQRLAIARAIMCNPKVLCLDEPTSALDQKSTEGLTKLILSLQQSDRSILVVSHDREFVRTLTKNNYLMEDGQLKKVMTVSSGFMAAS